MPSIDEKQGALTDILTQLDDLANSDGVVLVEGLRDVESLRNLGFGGRIETLSRAKITEIDLADRLEGEGVKVCILTDFDEEGRRMNRRMTTLLQRRGVNVDIPLRRSIARLSAKLGVYTIESLDNAAKRLY